MLKGIAIAALLVLPAGSAVASSSAKKGWHRCEVAWAITDTDGHTTKHLGSLCDGRGRVVFPFVFDFSESSGYRAIVTGFRKTGPRGAIADTLGDWYIKHAGECGEYGEIRDCTEWTGLSHIRYRTKDAGRHWRPIRFHRLVQKFQGPGPDPPPVVGTVEDDPPLDCTWSHMDNRDQVDGPSRSGYGNWCSPDQAWKVPDSLWP